MRDCEPDPVEVTVDVTDAETEAEADDVRVVNGVDVVLGVPGGVDAGVSDAAADSDPEAEFDAVDVPVGKFEPVLAAV